MRCGGRSGQGRAVSAHCLHPPHACGHAPITGSTCKADGQDPGQALGPQPVGWNKRADSTPIVLFPGTARRAARKGQARGQAHLQAREAGQPWPGAPHTSGRACRCGDEYRKSRPDAEMGKVAVAAQGGGSRQSRLGSPAEHRRQGVASVCCRPSPPCARRRACCARGAVCEAPRRAQLQAVAMTGRKVVQAHGTASPCSTSPSLVAASGAGRFCLEMQNDRSRFSSRPPHSCETSVPESRADSSGKRAITAGGAPPLVP